MADEWSGPRRLARVAGLVDGATVVKSAYTGAGGKEKDRVRVDLVEVTQGYEDGSEEELEARTLFIASEGKPGLVLASSIRKVASLPPKDKDLLGAIEGRAVEFAVSYEPFTTKDGQEHEMTLYRVVSIDTGRGVTKKVNIVEFLVGKTPAEAAKGRGGFAGAEAQALVSKTNTLKVFGARVELVDGRYALK